MMHHNTKFGNKMFGGLEDTIWTNINILTLCCDFDRECSNPFLHRTVWLMMMYHQIKFDGQGINSSENTVKGSYLDHMNPGCDLDLEDSNNKKQNNFFFFFLHDTLAHAAASPN